MKTNLSSLKTSAVCLAVLSLAGSVQAIPTPISGSISFSGTSTIDGTSFVSATRFSLFENVFVGAPTALTGDYVGASGAAVTMTPFIWDPPTASTPINPLWMFVSGGNTYSFDLSALHKDFASPNSLLLSGIGTAYITGLNLEKVATTGLWNFSAQTLGLSTFTFSSTTTIPTQAVPEGGSTIALLGMSLLGLVWMGRKQLQRS